MADLRTIVGAVTFLGLLSPAAQLSAAECRGWDEVSQAGQIAHKPIDEASGLGASRRHDGLLWTHNDSGDRPQLFVMAEDGAHVATVRLAGLEEAVDWEDMAVGPCAKGAEQSCVYVADIGDNRKKRDQVVIYKFKEPKLPKERPAELDVEEVEAIWFRYPAGPRDAEALMVHPQTAELYVVEKTSAGPSGVYRVPHEPAPEDNPHKASELGQLRLSALTGFGRLITAADISPDASEFTVRTYLSMHTFCIDDSFEAAITSTPAQSTVPFMVQSEALAYGRSGEAIWVTSERRPAPLYRFEKKKEKKQAPQKP